MSKLQRQAYAGMFGTPSSETPTRKKVVQEIALISITTDGHQLVGSGYSSFEEVQRKVRERIASSKNCEYPDLATQYTRFVIVASTSGNVHGVHILDEKGRPLFERFLP